MTENDWLTSDNPQAMLRYLTMKTITNQSRYGGKREAPLISDRKLRLLIEAMRDAASKLTGDDYWGADLTLDSQLLPTAELWLSDDEFLPQSDKCNLLREIVGNPFKEQRIVRLHCPLGHIRKHVQMGDQLICADCQNLAEWWYVDWLTPTVTRVAKSIYDGHTFEDMPILGDALEEAGCTNEEILRHCRQEERCIRCMGAKVNGESVCSNICNSGWIPERSPCVRGCWVLDLLLGKE